MNTIKMNRGFLASLIEVSNFWTPRDPIYGFSENKQEMLNKLEEVHLVRLGTAVALFRPKRESFMKKFLTVTFLTLSFVISSSAMAIDQNSTAKTVGKWSLAGIGDVLCMSGLTILGGKPITAAADKAVKGPFWTNNRADGGGNYWNGFYKKRSDGKFDYTPAGGNGYQTLTREEFLEKVGPEVVEEVENTAKYDGLVNKYSLILLAADAGICSGVIGEVMRNHGSVTESRTANVVGNSEPKAQPVAGSHPAN